MERVQRYVQRGGLGCAPEVVILPENHSSRVDVGPQHAVTLCILRIEKLLLPVANKDQEITDRMVRKQSD